jgi:glycerol-3-phosphate dehydrogenase
MASNNEIPRPIMIAALDEVYRVAEGLYLMCGGKILDGRKFARSIDDEAERCYQIATIVYLNSVRNQC